MKNVALVLSGGGAKGNAHMGVIEELEARGYTITSVAGTSMGALVGGIYASGKLSELKNWMCALDKFRVFQLVDFTLSNQGFVKGDKVLKTLRQFTGDQRIENLPIPYAAIASDLLNKKEMVFTHGSMFDAIRASIAIPTVITPVKHNGSLLVDGGVVNNMPVNRVKRIPGDILVAVNVNADTKLLLPPSTKKEKEQTRNAYQLTLQQFQQQLQKLFPEQKKEDLGYFDLLNHTLQFMMRHNEEVMLEAYPPDLLINVSTDTCGIFDFFKASETIEHGRYAAKCALDDFEKKLHKAG